MNFVIILDATIRIKHGENVYMLLSVLLVTFNGLWIRFRVMVLNATFHNISVIS